MPDGTKPLSDQMLRSPQWTKPQQHIFVQKHKKHILENYSVNTLRPKWNGQHFAYDHSNAFSSKCNFIEVGPKSHIGQQFNIGSGNGLAPYRRQVITWTNGDPIHWPIYAPPSLNKLKYCHVCLCPNELNKSSQRTLFLNIKTIIHPIQWDLYQTPLHKRHVLCREIPSCPGFRVGWSWLICLFYHFSWMHPATISQHPSRGRQLFCGIFMPLSLNDLPKVDFTCITHQDLLHSHNFRVTVCMELSWIFLAIPTINVHWFHNYDMWSMVQFMVGCILTHCGLVTPFADRDLGQHWLR